MSGNVDITEPNTGTVHECDHGSDGGQHGCICNIGHDHTADQFDDYYNLNNPDAWGDPA